MKDSLGIGSCMIARAAEVFATERGKEIQAEWGISEEYEAKLHLLLGYPEGEIPEAASRRDGRIIRTLKLDAKKGLFLNFYLQNCRTVICKSLRVV